MNFDPYKVLGVERTATYAEIKAAHRAMAKQYHPDMGGDEEQFAKVNLAWNLLKEVESRNEYDRTGDAGATAPDNTTSGAIAVLVGMICTIIDKCHQDNINPATIDMMGTLRATLTQQIAAARKKQQPPIWSQMDLEKVVKRLKKKNENANPLFLRALNEQVDHLRSIIEGIWNEISAIERALEIIDDYEFDPERIIFLAGNYFLNSVIT